MRHLITLALLAALAACGTRGSLTMPPGPRPAPLFGNASPAEKTKKPAPQPEASTSESPAGGDLNTAPKVAQ